MIPIDREVEKTVMELLPPRMLHYLTSGPELVAKLMHF